MELPVLVEGKVYSAQESFDFAAEYVFRQGEQSFETTACLYRGPRGLKCAIGSLLPDSLYETGMEQKGFVNYDKFPVRVQEYFKEHHPGLFLTGKVFERGHENYFVERILGVMIQKAHDDTTFTKGPGFQREFLASMLSVANVHKLDTTVVDKLVEELQ